MDFLERMNAAMEYIEENLSGEIDFQELGHLVGCSEYHLSRVFPFVTGQGLGLYIRRRRMSQAALELQGQKLDLLQVAVKYGYSSVDAFTRAFKEIHGVPPAAVRNGHHQVRSYPKLTFTLTIQGAVAMVYRIVTKDAFRILGIMKNVPLVFSGPNPEIDRMWTSLTQETILRWKSLSNTDPKGIISASTNFSGGRMTEQGSLDHYIGVATTGESADESACLEVDAGLWGVFEAVGDFPKNLQTVWGRIFAEWLPSSDYELREGPEILWNEGPDTTKPDFRSEIWIPLKKRTK